MIVAASLLGEHDDAQLDMHHADLAAAIAALEKLNEEIAAEAAASIVVESRYEAEKAHKENSHDDRRA